MRPRRAGRGVLSPISSTSTSSTKAVTSRLGNSPHSSPAKCARLSGRCANRSPADPVWWRLGLGGLLLWGAALPGAASAQTGDTVLQTSAAPARLPIEGNLPAFDGATQWLNSPPLTPAALRGKVVLVDFWTYTCINWLRTLPYIRAWAAKYKDQGLVVIGVHAPEFSFEKNLSNVRRSVKDMRIDYPIAI